MVSAQMVRHAKSIIRQRAGISAKMAHAINVAHAFLYMNKQQLKEFKFPKTMPRVILAEAQDYKKNLGEPYVSR